MHAKGWIPIILLVVGCSYILRLKSKETFPKVAELEIIKLSEALEYEDSTFEILSWNVENLFDDVEDGYEYRDYSKHSSNYSKNLFLKKVSNIARVIRDAEPEVVVLQEVESRRALRILLDSLRSLGFYYGTIADKPQRTVVNVAILSKFPILEAYGYYTIDRVRNILLAKLSIGKDTFFIVANHWKSKSGPESQRIACAKVARAIVDSLLNLDPKVDIVVLGDFNTHVREKQSDVLSGDAFEPKAVIGLVHVLGAVSDTLLLKEGYLYNLWYELPEELWGSHYFAGEWGTLDHILVSYGLFDTSGIYYIPGSFRVFKREYLLDARGIPYRWKLSRGEFTYHFGEGFSDHLPIYARFGR